MSKSNSSTDRCYGGSIADELNQFVDAVTAALSETEAPNGVVTEVESTGEALANKVEELEEQVDTHEKKLEFHLEDIVEVDSRVDEIEEDLEGDIEGGNPTPEGPETGIQGPETPLERVVGLPEHLVDGQLTANQERARFIARDVSDYSRKVPAGRSIDSGTIRKVLKARDGKVPHTETVGRVMDFLDELGKDGTKVVKRRGTRRVIFTEDTVERLERLSTRETSAEEGSDHGVVIGKT